MSILIAGIGNIFLGDDGFGVEVAGRLRYDPLLAGVDVADFGIRGIHLACELADGRYDAAILVDALPRGGPPGTLYAIEPDVDADELPLDGTDAHSLPAASVIAWLRRVGGRCGRVVVVGCEPATIEESMTLSGPVAAAVDGAVRMIRDLVAEMHGAPLPIARSFDAPGRPVDRSL